MNNCPCCGTTLLRHINHDRLYWFCPHCWQEMPNFDSLKIINYHLTVKIEKLASLQPVSKKRFTTKKLSVAKKPPQHSSPLYTDCPA
ncbi:MAG: hypothetical protein QNJ54_07100 [Prochloraceae cyanobacterium]|nr:hypothetical protein [Prochloraceae cyanobacterium]